MAGRRYIYAGLDGCRGGWLTAYISSERPASPDNLPIPSDRVRLNVFRSIGDFVCFSKSLGIPVRIMVDIPIGLPSGSSGRKCDRFARRFIGRRRGSVFPPPCREAVYASSYHEANELNRRILGKGLSKQAWNITAKIREADIFLCGNPDLMDVVVEGHPEVGFTALNGGMPMRYYKKTPEGIRERISVLSGYIDGVRRLIGSVGFKDAEIDDILDALCMLVCAYLLTEGDIRRLDGYFGRDSAGFPMRILFPLGVLKDPSVLGKLFVNDDRKL